VIYPAQRLLGGMAPPPAAAQRLLGGMAPPLLAGGTDAIAAKLLGTETHKRRRVKYRPFFDAPIVEPEPPQDENATPPAPTLGVEKIVRDSVRDVLAAIARLPAPADDTRVELESELEPIAQSTRPEPLPAAPLIPQDPDLLYDNERRRAMLIALIMATAE
jgi:hypothetical protein